MPSYGAANEKTTTLPDIEAQLRNSYGSSQANKWQHFYINLVYSTNDITKTKGFFQKLTSINTANDLPRLYDTQKNAYLTSIFYEILRKSHVAIVSDINQKTHEFEKKKCDPLGFITPSDYKQFHEQAKETVIGDYLTTKIQVAKDTNHNSHGLKDSSPPRLQKWHVTSVLKKPSLDRLWNTVCGFFKIHQKKKPSEEIELDEVPSYSQTRKN